MFKYWMLKWNVRMEEDLSISLDLEQERITEVETVLAPIVL